MNIYRQSLLINIKLLNLPLGVKFTEIYSSTEMDQKFSCFYNFLYVIIVKCFSNNNGFTEL